MRRIILYWLLAAVFLPVSCMQDPVSPENDLDEPVVGYDAASLTRASVILTGSFKDSPEITEYGFEMAENSFGEGESQTIANPPKDGKGYFTYQAALSPGRVYNVRTYFTNGVARKYSKTVTVKAPTTSVATVSDVSLSYGRLTARILDDGGTPVREVGFCWSEAAEPEIIKRHKIEAEMGEDNTFSLDLSHFPWGKIYYFLAYAENSSQSSGEAFGYSLHPVELEVSDDLPVDIADPAFARVLIDQYDTNRNGALSYKEISSIKTLSFSTDGISDIGEIRMMPLLTSLSCRGSSSGSGGLEQLDLSGNPLLRQLSVRGNRLKVLDITPCPDLESLDATLCPQLEIIYIRAEQKDLAEQVFKKDAHTSFLLDPESAIPIPDAHFRKYLVDRFDRNGDNRISVSEAAAITRIDVCTDDIQTVAGIEFFDNLTQLRCAGSYGASGNLPLGRLVELDVSENLSLNVLDCTANPALTQIWLKSGQSIETFNYDSGVATVHYK